MHKFYISGVLLPIPPSSLKTSIEDKDEEIDLANGGTMTVLNQPGLTTYSFEFRVPNVKYPFATYSNGFLEAPAFLSILGKLKTSQQPFTFKVIRGDKYVDYRDINTTVSLVDYTITEDAENNGDYMIDIELKEYVKYSTYLPGDIIDGSITIEQTTERDIIIVDSDTQYYLGANDYIIQEGDTFQSISEKFFGNMNYAEAIAKHNNAEYTTDELIAGKVLNLNEEEIKAIAEEIDTAAREKQEEEYKVYYDGDGVVRDTSGTGADITYDQLGIAATGAVAGAAAGALIGSIVPVVGTAVGGAVGGIIGGIGGFLFGR